MELSALRLLSGTWRHAWSGREEPPAVPLCPVARADRTEESSARARALSWMRPQREVLNPVTHDVTEIMSRFAKNACHTSVESFSYEDEIHPTKTFQGQCLPKKPAEKIHTLSSATKLSTRTHPHTHLQLQMARKDFVKLPAELITRGAGSTSCVWNDPGTITRRGATQQQYV